ncbi:MAG: hypothetical protein ABFD94_18835, partial [Armatimonadia bacterium]
HEDQAGQTELFYRATVHLAHLRRSHKLHQPTPPSRFRRSEVPPGAGDVLPERKATPPAN